MNAPTESLWQNISSIVEGSLCTGCGTCVSLCESHAIEMHIDDSLGIPVPSVEDRLCTGCGMCLKACPGYSVHLDSLNVSRFGIRPINSDIGCVNGVFFGYSSDIEIRASSSSGGLVTSLLAFALDAGIIDAALVTRMRTSSPLEPEAFLAKNHEEILSSARSKYCPVPVNTALCELLTKPGRYAVVGLPCHIHGICKAMEIVPELRTRIALIFGLVCNHTPSHHATEYLLKRNGISKDMVGQIAYRGGGWPGVLSLEMRDGSKRTIPFNSASYWGFAFQKFFFPHRCSVCIDKTCELSDVSFMDAWLPQFSREESGMSLIIARTDSAISLIERAAQSGIIHVETAHEDDVRKSQSIGPSLTRRAAMIRFVAESGRLVPDYGRALPDTSAYDCLAAIMFYLRMKISTKRRLWFAIMLYERLWRLLRAVRQ